MGSSSPRGLSPSSLTSPTHAAQTLASFARQPRLSAETICDLPLLMLLVDDYFTYIHPLVPIPHEPSFREALRRREDLSNPTFLGLLASMIGILVASFPRKPKQHLKTMQKESLFPKSMTFVDRCHRVVIEARGPGYLDKPLTVYDGTISYLLGLTEAYVYNWKQGKLYLAECLSILCATAEQSLNVSTNPDPTYQTVYATPSPPSHITQQIWRRLFWVLFVGVRTAEQLGASSTELFIPPPSARNPYPPLPLEVDDAFIFGDRVSAQPHGVLSELAGFLANVHVYRSYDKLAAVEMANCLDDLFDWDRTRSILQFCLLATKELFTCLPSELSLNPRSRTDTIGFSFPCREAPPAAPSHAPSSSGSPLEGPIVASDLPTTLASPIAQSPRLPQYSAPPNDTDPLVRRYMQYEIQKANIYLSQLGTRSHLVEKYTALRQLHRARGARQTGMQPAVNGTAAMKREAEEEVEEEADIAEEREHVIHDLLLVLSTISQVNMEPNGASFVSLVPLNSNT